MIEVKPSSYTELSLVVTDEKAEQNKRQSVYNAVCHIGAGWTARIWNTLMAGDVIRFRRSWEPAERLFDVSASKNGVEVVGHSGTMNVEAIDSLIQCLVAARQECIRLGGNKPTNGPVRPFEEAYPEAGDPYLPADHPARQFTNLSVPNLSVLPQGPEMLREYLGVFAKPEIESAFSTGLPAPNLHGDGLYADELHGDGVDTRQKNEGKKNEGDKGAF